VTDTECVCGIEEVSTRRPLGSAVLSKKGVVADSVVEVIRFGYAKAPSEAGPG
jgi:hypothetical protein